MSSQYVDLPVEGGSGGVTSLNSLTGALTLVAGSNITITPAGSNITIAATGASLTFADSLVNTAGTVTLVGDTASPTASQYYGTNSGSTLGFYNLPAPGTGTVTSVSVVSANGLAGTVATSTTTPAITLSTSITGILQGNGTAISAATTGNLTDAGTDGITVTGGTGAVLGSGTSLAQHVADTSHNGYLSSTDWNTFNGKQAAGSYITDLTGDGTASGPGSAALTLATVNSNVGSFGSSTSIPSFTVNGKGLITAASGNAVVAPAGTLTGTTLASNVVTSSLTTVGTIGTGVWQGTAIGPTFGGTGLTSYTAGDTLYASATNVLSKLPIGTTGYVLTVVAGEPAWAPIGGSGTVTSVALSVPSFLSVSGSPITSSGTLAVTLSGTALPVANGGTGDTSFTPYAVITGGTTSGGALQNVSGLGTTGQVLTSAGAGALPTWTTLSGTGTVTSVALTDGSTTPIYSISGSPVTTSGTLNFTLATQSANLIFAGPSSGAAAQPTFRSMVLADMPVLGGQHLYANVTAGGAVPTSVFILSLNANNSTQVVGADTNDNVWVNTVSQGFATTATAAGTTTLTLASPPIQEFTGSTTQTVKLPSGASAVAGYAVTIMNKSSGNLTVQDSSGGAIQTLPANNKVIYVLSATGSPGTWDILSYGGGAGTVTSVALTVPSFLSVSGSPITSSGTLAVSLSGTALPIANGGTAATTAAAAYNNLSPMTTTGDMEYESGTNTASRLAIGSTGQVLTVSGGVPTWQTSGGGGSSSVMSGWFNKNTNTLGAIYYLQMSGYNPNIGVGSGVASGTNVAVNGTFVSRAGTVANLYVTELHNISTAVDTYTVYKNGSATALTVAITGSGSTTVPVNGSDTTHSFSVAAGDYISLQFNPDAAGVPPHAASWSVTIA